MPKQCAYCGRTGDLTREHIWPDWLLRRTAYMRAYSARAGKIVGREQTIGDVCGRCNNIHLGRLDAYAKDLYDEYFQHWVDEGQEVYLRYDHGLLLRWLLKVAYNSARSTGTNAELLARYADVLIAEHPCTPTFAFAFVGTIMPAHVLDPGATTFRAIQPQGARCGSLIIPHFSGDPRFATRMITLNGYFFTLVIVDDPTMDVADFAELTEYIYGVPLTPAGRTLVPRPGMNTLQAMRGVETWPEDPRHQARRRTSASTTSNPPPE